MKKLFSILTIIFLSVNLCAQPKGCSDSIVFNKFSPTLFQYFNGGLKTVAQRDTIDNIFVGGSYGGYTGFTGIIKFNPTNQPVWAKWYRPANNNSAFKNFGQLVAIDDSANLFFTGGTTSAPAANNILVAKLDSVGGFKWAKELAFPNNPNYRIGYEVPISNGGNLFFCSGEDIAAISTAGNILWMKKYGVINIPGFRISGTKLSSFSNNRLLVCITGYTSPNGLGTHPNAAHYIHFVKISGSTGAVLQQQTIRCYTDAAFNNLLTYEPVNLNYDPVSGIVLLAGLVNTFVTPSLSKQVYCKLDSNFNVVNTVNINSNTALINQFAFNESAINISKKNEVSFAYQEQNFNATDNKLNYITINSNLQITAQRKINYNPFGFIPDPIKTTIGFKKDGSLNFQSGGWSNTSGNFPETLIIFDHIPFYNTLSPCLGYDTTFFYSTPAYTQPVSSLNFQDTANVTATVTDVVPDGLPLQNFTLPQEQICKQVSICDTIKVTGNNFRCLSTALDTFKLVRNPLCKRVTKWQVDTSAIKIVNSTDTSIYVQYLKAYNGFVKVNFAGCTLTDSLPISVYSIPANGLNLGNDVVACPGTPITITAATGFKTYLWQDGSIAATYIANQPGKYYVTATDSCDRSYTDTIQVFEPAIKTPNLGNDTMHCPGRTITLHAGVGYKNYLWQDGSVLESYTALQPGKYYVTVTDSCNRQLSDSIEVKPQDIVFSVNYPIALCSWDTAKINLSNLFNNYTWQPFGSATLLAGTQWLLYPGTTTLYSISGERPAGCILSDTVLITIKNCPDYIYFPNAFTPNKDGLNDVYKPTVSGRIIVYEFSIYNRYGQPVFKSNTPNQGWNGNFNNSQKTLPGGYVWHCRYQFINQPLVQKKGIFILIR